MLLLSNIQLNENVRVVGFIRGCDQGFRRQVMSMGLLPNSVLSIVRVAPFNDPVEIRLRDYRLIVRRADAQYIQVERL
jgi:ferrous iron transport protein A